MTWEETIKFIRTQPKYANLVEKAYFEEDLALNVERFRKSDEFQESLTLIKKFLPTAKRVLDIGSGNGISAVALSLEGYHVTTVEPDPSDTIGAGAIRKLKEIYNLSELQVFENYAEDIMFPEKSFDFVYTRQCMHHAYNLKKFISEASRVLMEGGFLFTIRDHVVFDEKDKVKFLNNHPLHKYYGGENAFSPEEYKMAFANAGLTVMEELKHFDSVINYFPTTKAEMDDFDGLLKKERKAVLKLKFGKASNIPGLLALYESYLSIRYGDQHDERNVPGRMYSYICKKGE